MIRRPRLLLLLGLIALLVLWAWLVLHPKHQPLGVPTKANFERVREGMTPEEVEAILWPEGLHTTRELSVAFYKVRIGSALDRTPWQEWAEDDCTIVIEYSDPDTPRVAEKRYIKLTPETFRERLRRWLHWCERAFRGPKKRGVWPPLDLGVVSWSD